MKEKFRFSRDYLIDLGSEAVGWFIGGVVGGLALDTLNVNELGNIDVWKTGLALGSLAVVKGLAAKFVGDPQTTTFHRY